MANQDCADGVEYILGADTHERVCEPLQGKFCKVTEPGALASFVGKLDLVVENGTIKEQTYAMPNVPAQLDEPLAQMLRGVLTPQSSMNVRAGGRRGQYDV